MFIEYDARQGLNNQEMTPAQIVLDFSPQHVTDYENLCTSVLADFRNMQGNDSVKRLVRLCAIEVKFLYGCTVSWDGSDTSVAASPSRAQPASAGPDVRAQAGALSDGGNETDPEAEKAGADERADEDSDPYGEGDDRGGDRFVHFTERFDAENALDGDWSDFKYPVPEHFVARFREAHAIAAMFHLNDELAAKFPILNGQIHAGWQAHYKRPIHIDQILQPPTTGEFGWGDEDMQWLVQTVRFYLSSMSTEQLEERGIKPERARQIIKMRKVRRALPHVLEFLFALRAAAADGRAPPAVTAGFASCGLGRSTTPRPQEGGRLDIEVHASNRRSQTG